MATPRWTGKAKATAQVNTYAFGGTWEADDLIRVTIGSKTIDFTAGSTTTATVVSNLVTTWNALASTSYPEFAEITASASTTTLILTADTAGKPFTATLTPLESNAAASGSQTIGGDIIATTGTIATANAGPNSWATTGNWSTGAVPTTGDTFYIDDTDDEILYDLDQTGITPTAGVLGPNFTGLLGLPKMNTDSTEYPEYRSDFLKFTGITACTINCQSSRIKIDGLATASAFTVLQTGQGEDGLEACLLRGTSASNVLIVSGESQVGVAVYGAETSNLSGGLTLNGGTVRCGLGVTLAAIINDGGTLEVNGAIATSLTQQSGITTINGTGAAALIVGRLGAQIIYNSTGTLGGACILADGSVIDFSQDSRAKAITNPVDCFSGGNVFDPNKKVASLICDFNGEVANTSGWGSNVRVTRAAVA